MTQSGLVADALRTLGMPVELETVRTLGDQRPPDTTWGEGAFVGALETALLSGEVDLAVHSAKDVPTTEDPRLVIAAYPRREDPRDALVGREPGLTLEALSAGSRVGHGQPAPDRLPPGATARPSDSIRCTATWTPGCAGSTAARRTRWCWPWPASTDSDLEGRIGEILASDVVPPAPGQGSLAVQCRADDETTRAWLARLDDPATRAAVETERAFLHASGGGCRAPIGGLARVEGDEIVLVAGSAGIDAAEAQDPDGDRARVAWGTVRGPIADRVALAAGLAARLNEELAGRLPDGAAIGARRACW